jgi:crotonobetainyl-CoA:carnitine CoA-transferase CaiB-like acyl-CoA transferase
LDDVRVLDLSESIGGGYCARLLSLAGARVVVGEADGGHPLRSWSWAGPGSVDDGPLFAYLHAGHRAELIAPSDRLDQLIAEADVVILDDAAGRPDARDLVAAHPTLVVVSISPYGLTGPYAHLPGSELTVQADSGALAIRGHPSRPPVQAGGRSTEWLSGSYAAAGAVALIRRRDLGGPGGLVDVSWAEVASLSCTLFADVADALAGRPDLSSRPARSLETPSIEPTLDGYVGFNTNTAQMFSDFLVLIERADLMATDPSLVQIGGRLQRWDEWNGIVHDWTTRHTTAEIVDAAALLRIPAAPVTDAEAVLGLDHFVERGVFVDEPSGRMRFPRRPWRFDGEDIPAPGVAPGRAVPDQSAGDSAGGSSRNDDSPAVDHHGAGPAPMPGAGITVVDVTTWWAGAAASNLLGAIGADVIHVESANHVDGMRMIGGMFADRENWWELSSFFLSINTNKRGVTLDLGQAEGRDLLLRLVEKADVVMENFTPRVLERFDLGWDVIHEANPGAVMVRMPAFGLDGPWRNRPGFAQTMEQVTGLAWLTGHIDDQPRIQRGPCDPNAGMHAALATLVALRQRDRTGIGSFVEVPMVEAALAIAAEPVLEWTAYGHRLGRIGNRSPQACPQGVFACAGYENWLALSVTDDDVWAALVAALDEPVWAKNPSLATLAGRRADEERLEAGLAEWAAGVDRDEAVAALRAAGVPAAPAWNPRRASEHPQFAARGYYEKVDHPVAGVVAVPTLPMRLSGIDRWTARPAPTLGQHNAEVLGLLGLDADDLGRLADTGVIGTRPRGL